jgi:regulator of sirC expression with transglutaminase-like and TPR domain
VITRPEDLLDESLELERVAFDSSRPDFDLLSAAALLPRVEGREPHVERVVAEVDGWAEEVRQEAARRTSWQGPLHALVTVLFSRVRLRGDAEEYDAPRNSFLEDVVARRRGLPISLSLLVVETARRAGLLACGLALPRHFMAGVMLQRGGGASGGPDPLGSAEGPDGADLYFLDAFHAQVLPPEDVAQRVGLPLDELAEHLSPAPPEVILLRMLTNLRASYLRRQDAPCCLRVVSRLLLLKPRDGALHLERAHLKSALGDLDGALMDAQAGLKLARDPEEKDAAERILERLSQTAGWVH